MIARAKSRRLSSMTIDEAINDPGLLGAALGDALSWKTWRVVLKAAFGIELNRDEARAFESVAGSRSPPTQRVRELWCIIGRRGGKSKIAAALAVYFALFTSPRLSVGEIGTVAVIAASRDQAAVVFNYVKGFFAASEILQREVVASNASEITLRNGIVISVHSTSFRTVRGRTLIACIFDEVAFWRDETSATPDIETYRAILPALATTNGMLIGISTPYRKIGLLNAKHRDHFGIDSDDVLVVKGGTTVFNPTLSAATIETQRQADPTSATSEWDAEFRTDISTFLDDELIDAAVEHGRPLELPPRPFPAFYRAFTDSAGGTGRDAYTLAIAHMEAEHFVIDLVRGTRPGQKFDPQQVTNDYAKLLKEYRVSSVTGDNYSAQWVAGAWQHTNILYVQSDIPKSQIYLECLPLFTRGLVVLPDHARLLKELRLLERQTHRGGKDSVDHPRGQHDDYANSVCGVLRTLSNHLGFDATFNWNDGTDDDDRYSEVALKRRQRIQAIMRGHLDGDSSQAHPNLSNADLRRFAQPVALGVLLKP
jgi:Phage Terminase